VHTLLQMFPGVERAAIMAALQTSGGSLSAAVGMLLDAAPSTSSPQAEKRNTSRPGRTHGSPAQPVGWSAFTARLQQQSGVSHASGGALLADPAGFPRLSPGLLQHPHDAGSKGLRGGWQHAPAGPSVALHTGGKAGGVTQQTGKLQRLSNIHPWAEQALLEVGAQPRLACTFFDDIRFDWP
jgi:hypothetical protein